jgi:sirohydrochlorin ferrochelatase
MENKKAILVVNHGSRSRDAVAQFEKILTLVRSQSNYKHIKGAHMELAEPTIPTVVKEIAEMGVTEIIVVPYFLFNGNHIKHDIPEILTELQSVYPSITFTFGNPIGFEPLMADILMKRIAEADCK